MSGLHGKLPITFLWLLRFALIRAFLSLMTRRLRFIPAYLLTKWLPLLTSIPDRASLADVHAHGQEKDLLCLYFAVDITQRQGEETGKPNSD